MQVCCLAEVKTLVISLNSTNSNSVSNTKSILHQIAGILVPSDLIAPPNPTQNGIIKSTTAALGITKQQQQLSFT